MSNPNLFARLCITTALGLAAAGSMSATLAQIDEEGATVQPRSARTTPAPTLERRTTDGPISVLRCYQHGIRIVDEEIDSTLTMPPSGPKVATTLASGGDRLHLVTFEHTFCLVRMRPGLGARTGDGQ